MTNMVDGNVLTAGSLNASIDKKNTKVNVLKVGAGSHASSSNTTIGSLLYSPAQIDNVLYGFLLDGVFFGANGTSPTMRAAVDVQYYQSAGNSSHAGNALTLQGPTAGSTIGSMFLPLTVHFDSGQTLAVAFQTANPSSQISGFVGSATPIGVGLL